MKRVREYPWGQWRLRAWQLLAFLSLIGLLWAIDLQAEQRLQSLVVNREVYSNVVIQTKTDTHVFFNHDGGFASVKVSDIPSTGLRQLGYEAEEAPQTPALGSGSAVTQIAPQLWQKTLAISQPMQATILPMIIKMLWLVVGLTVLAHIIISFCFLLICRKAGQEPGIAVWIPVLQMFPLLRAANMSGWSFLLFLLPVLNIIAALVWCVKLCQALHKSPLLGFLLFLPLTGIFILLYLAFSSSENSDEPQVIKLDYSPSPTTME